MRDVLDGRLGVVQLHLHRHLVLLHAGLQLAELASTPLNFLFDVTDVAGNKLERLSMED